MLTTTAATSTASLSTKRLRREGRSDEGIQRFNHPALSEDEKRGKSLGGRQQKRESRVSKVRRRDLFSCSLLYSLEPLQSLAIKCRRPTGSGVNNAQTSIVADILKVR